MKKWLAIVVASGSLACGGSSPTAPTAPPANIAGPYSLTITAAPTCAANLPFPILGFASTNTQTGAAIQAQLVGHAPGAPTGTVSGTVSGQTVSFASFPLTEAMGRGATFAGSANLNVASSGMTMTGTLSGTFQTPSGLSCNSTSHQIEMVKLCPQTTATGTVLAPCQ